MDRILKFIVVGGIGFFINTSVLIFGVRLGLAPSISGPLGAEIAILSNFTLNNFWTFSDRKITSWQAIPGKFLEFNILSFGSVLIQFVFLKVGEKIFGLTDFKKPFIELPMIRSLPIVPVLINWVNKVPPIANLARKFSAYFIFYMAGVGVGLVVNFIIYSQIIWR